MRGDFVTGLYEEYLGMLVRYCEYLLRYDPKFMPQVEDVVHDVFVVALRKEEALRRHPNPCGWLMKACWNKCYTLLRRELGRGARLELLGEITADAQQDAIIRLLERLNAQELLQALQEKLSETERRVYPAYFVDQKSAQEAADGLDMKKSAVEEAVRRIRRKAARLDKLIFFLCACPNLSLLIDIIIERRIG